MRNAFGRGLDENRVCLAMLPSRTGLDERDSLRLNGAGVLGGLQRENGHEELSTQTTTRAPRGSVAHGFLQTATTETWRGFSDNTGKAAWTVTRNLWR